MLGSVNPNSFELRADSFIAVTACPEVCLVQILPKSNYYNPRYLGLLRLSPLFAFNTVYM